MNQREQKMLLVLDIGTSAVKCGCVDSEGTLVAHRERRFPLRQSGRLFESDFSRFFEMTRDLLGECLSETAVRRNGVGALLITSQAQTFVPVDAGFRLLRPGIVWLDERAGEEAVFWQQHLPDFAAMAGFVKPLPSLYLSKLLWLKRQEPDIFEAASAFPLIHEYLVWKLTGHFYSDTTNFGMGGVYDFRRSGLNRRALEILGLSEASFPDVKQATGRGEWISKQIQKEWNWPERFPVFLCGNDQGASACGAGVQEIGDVNINLGTALVFYTITESLTTKLTEDQIAGKHPVGDAYFLLNFEPDFGLQMRRLKEAFFGEGTYDDLFQTYFQFPEAPANRSLFEKMRWQALSGVRAHQACAGVIKFYVKQLKAHFSQIQQTVPVKNIFVSGGMLQSKVLLKIVQDVLQRPLTIENRAHAGLLGAVKIYRQNKMGEC